MRDRPAKAAEIAASLRARLAQAPAVARLPGIEKLAAEFGVNRKTADRALRQLVCEGLLVRRRGFGTFPAAATPALAAQLGDRLRVNSRKYALLLRTSEAYLGYMRLLTACDEVFAEIGGSLLLLRFDDACPEGVLGRLRAQHVEGVMVTGLISDELLRRLRREFSVLLVDSLPESVTVDAVVWDYFDSAYGLGEHLARSGRRRVCLLQATTGPLLPEALARQHGLRREGLAAACADHGLEFLPWLSDWSFAAPDGLAGLCAALRAAPDDTVFVAPVPATVLNRLASLDLVGRLQLAGFEDRGSLAGALPGVYVVHDYAEMGHAAARRLCAILGRPVGLARMETLAARVEVIDWRR